MRVYIDMRDETAQFVLEKMRINDLNLEIN